MNSWQLKLPDALKYKTCSIRNSDGFTVYKMRNVELAAGFLRDGGRRLFCFRKWLSALFLKCVVARDIHSFNGSLLIAGILIQAPVVPLSARPSELVQSEARKVLVVLPFFW